MINHRLESIIVEEKLLNRPVRARQGMYSLASTPGTSLQYTAPGMCLVLRSSSRLKCSAVVSSGINSMEIRTAVPFWRLIILGIRVSLSPRDFRSERPTPN